MISDSLRNHKSCFYLFISQIKRVVLAHSSTSSCFQIKKIRWKKAHDVPLKKPCQELLLQLEGMIRHRTGIPSNEKKRTPMTTSVRRGEYASRTPRKDSRLPLSRDGHESKLSIAPKGTPSGAIEQPHFVVYQFSFQIERQLFVFIILHYVHAEIEKGNEEENYHYVGHGVTHNGSHPDTANQTKEAADGGDNPNDSTELIHGAILLS